MVNVELAQTKIGAEMDSSDQEKVAILSPSPKGHHTRRSFHSVTTDSGISSEITRERDEGIIGREVIPKSVSFKIEYDHESWEWILQSSFFNFV